MVEDKQRCWTLHVVLASQPMIRRTTIVILLHHTTELLQFLVKVSQQAMEKKEASWVRGKDFSRRIGRTIFQQSLNI
jgi:hypothetical protein